jgi:hypothetical protein
MQGPPSTAYGLAAAPEGAECLERDLECATCGCAMLSSDPWEIVIDASGMRMARALEDCKID